MEDPLPAIFSPDPEIRPLSQLLQDMADSFSDETVSVDRIIEALHERGFGIFIFFIAVPILVPFPKPPGVTAALSVPILLTAAQMALGRRTVWFPEKMRARTISRVRLIALIDKLMPWLVRLEKFVRPRMGTMTRTPFSRLTGLAGMAFSLAIFFLPIPGFGAIPSLSLCLIGVGDVMRDGLMILAGIFLGTAWIAFLAFFFLFIGVEGLVMAEQWLLSFL